MSATLRSSLLTLAALGLAACGSAGIVVGNNHIVSEQRTVPSFNKLSVQYGIHAELSRGDREVAITTDQNLMPLIETYVQDDTLFLRVRSNYAVTSTHGITAVVNNPTLTAIDASGGSNVNAVATFAADWPIVASGGSTVSVSALQADRVTIDASGGSHVDAFGLTTDVSVVGSGGSRVSTDGLVAENVTVNASGGSILHVRASKSARGDASGGSQVSVSGNPATRQISSSGASIVTYGAE